MEKKYEPRGTHVICDMYGVDKDLLDDIDFLEQSLIKAINLCGMTILSKESYKFQPEGCTVMLLLSESHASLHTYVSDGVIFYDIFTCGESDPGIAIDYLLKILKPTKVKIDCIERGINKDV